MSPRQPCRTPVWGVSSEVSHGDRSQVSSSLWCARPQSAGKRGRGLSSLVTEGCLAHSWCPVDAPQLREWTDLVPGLGLISGSVVAVTQQAGSLGRACVGVAGSCQAQSSVLPC